jgi:hypothetical protein
VVVEIGAGTAIPSVRRFGERLVRERQCHLIRINVREAWTEGLCLDCAQIGHGNGRLGALELHACS